MQKLTTTQFIDRANRRHNFRYTYHKSSYVRITVPIIITCLTHGDFEQTPDAHLSGCGCPKCAGNIKASRDEFIANANLKHNQKFDYSKVVYRNCDTQVIIICPDHGEFKQTPFSHLRAKKGCPDCSGKRKLTNDEFIERANRRHDWKYDYKHTVYSGMYRKINILCPNHGVFAQLPVNHLSGNGCPDCRLSHGELAIDRFLKKNHFVYQKQYKINECRNKKPLPFDFAIFRSNELVCLIEYQGEQHYICKHRTADDAKNQAEFLAGQQNDSVKRGYCKENNIRLIEIPYWDQYRIPQILMEVL